MILNNEQLNIELNKLRDERGDLKPEEVVKVASNPSSPLHDFFEWNDTEAGKEYRLWQARQLITRVYRIIDEDKDMKVQVFYNIVREDGSQAYNDADTILSDEVLKKQLMASAVTEIEYWMDKYKKIKLLARIVNSKVLKEVKELIK